MPTGPVTDAGLTDGHAVGDRPRTATGELATQQIRVGAILTLAAALLGCAVRLYFALGADFPLHDGGLFYVMVRDLQRAGYALPAYTTYNSAGLPFAYPPLALYLAGLLDDLTPLGLLDVFRWLPLAATCLTVGAFALLARSLLASPLAAAFAVAAFGLLPESFRWSLMGGGVTRALGYLFAILALQQVYLMYTRQARRHVALAILLAGGAVLSHPELGLFAAYSSALLFLAFGRGRAGLRRTAVVAAGVALVTAPWWLAVVAHHGVAVFASAASRGGTLYSGVAWLLFTNVTGEARFPFIGALAFFGLVACLGARQFLAPAWLLVAFLGQPRGARLEAAVPLALLAGVGVAEVLLPLLERQSVRAGRRLAVALLTFVLLYSLSALRDGQRPYLSALPSEEREAMAWVAAHTAESSAFLVITGDAWGADRSSEWFPALAGRSSLATVQGFEWAGRDEYARRIEWSRAAQACAGGGVDCLERWSRETGQAFDYVYLPKRPPAGGDGDCCRPLRASLAGDPRYAVAYDGPGAVIYRRATPSGRR